MTDLITEPAHIEPTAPAAEQPAERSEPRWLTEATASVRRIRSFAPHAKHMVERDANETDTRLLVTDLLTDVLGWDKYSDLSTEYQVRGEFADYALRLDGQVFAMVEVKRAAQKLTERHLRQIESYGLREGADWLILTNGVMWKVYRLCSSATGTKPEHLFTVDLSAPAKADADNLLGLHKQGAKREVIEELWRKHAALTPSHLDRVILSERVLNAIRLEVKSTVGYNATMAEVEVAAKRRLASG